MYTSTQKTKTRSREQSKVLVLISAHFVVRVDIFNLIASNSIHAGRKLQTESYYVGVHTGYMSYHVKIYAVTRGLSNLDSLIVIIDEIVNSYL